MRKRTRWRPEDYMVNGLGIVLVFVVLGIVLNDAFGGFLGLICAAGGLLGIAWLVTGVVLKLVQLAERDQ